MQTTDPFSVLEKYRPTQTGAGWHTAPDDAYLYDHLAQHLHDAQLYDELTRLFADDRWLHARVQQSGYTAYLADLQLAWDVRYQEALHQIETGEISSAFLECVQLTIIECSLRSWAESQTPSIIARAVEVGLWTPKRALSLAALIPDEQRRAQMYAVLAKTAQLSPEQIDEAKREALKAAQGIEYSGSRAMTLSMLSSQTEAEQQHEAIAAALEAALAAADDLYGGNGFSLWELIDKLPADLLDRATSGVQALKNPEAKAWALAALAQRAPEDQRQGILQEGLEATLQIQRSDVSQANALAQLADQLRGDLVSQALDAALALKEGEWRPRAIAGLMDQLSEEQVTRTLDSMLTITDEWWRADGLMRVVEHFYWRNPAPGASNTAGDPTRRDCWQDSRLAGLFR